MKKDKIKIFIIQEETLEIITGIKVLIEVIVGQRITLIRIGIINTITTEGNRKSTINIIKVNRRN